jgi:hypothetical protein
MATRAQPQSTSRILAANATQHTNVGLDRCAKMPGPADTKVNDVIIDIVQRASKTEI